MDSSNYQANSSTDVENYRNSDAVSSETNNIIDLNDSAPPQATDIECSYRDEHHLESIKRVYDLLGEWGFYSCRQIFWDNEVTMYCLQNMNDNELSDLCKLSNMRIGLKTMLRLKIEDHFNKRSSINSVDDYRKLLDQQLKHVTSNKAKGVYDILKSNPKGGILLSMKKLNDSSRNIVVENIVNYYLDNNILLDKESYTKIASEIVKIYPKDTVFLFYKPACEFDGKKHKATGKLVDKHNNEKSQRKKLMELVTRSETTKEPTTSASSSPDESSIEEQKTSMKWLENSRTPVELVNEHWKKSFRIRQEFFETTCVSKKILLAWPVLSTTMCPNLINIDFELRYGEKTQLFKLWPSFVDKVRFRINDIKDPNSKLFAKNLKKKLTVDGTNIIICYLLSSMIIPTFKKNLAKRGTPKDFWRTTIHESRKAFIEHAQNSIQMELIIQGRKKIVQEKGLNFQPMIIVLGGEEIFEGQHFYVCYDGIVQKFPHFVEAVDFAFKLTLIFNAKYSEDCQQIWTFFQLYFYKISTDVPEIQSVLINKSNRYKLLHVTL